jgi:hypothetical protein
MTARPAVAALILTIVGCSGDRALQRRSGGVSQAGDTLRVRFDNGRDTTFINTHGSEADIEYRYAGRIGEPPYHLIEIRGGEVPPSWILIRTRTGRGVVVSDEPVLSPDSRHFAIAAADWNNCSERDQPDFEIWELTDTVPARELRLLAFDCRRQSGWGPTHPKWISADTLQFIRNELEIKIPAASSGSRQIPIVSRPMLIVRDHSQWLVLDRH